jgi:hypothetical protein
MDPITFQAIIYRDLKFASDGGGRITLEFPANQEFEVVKLLTLRECVLTVSVTTSGEIPA